jgi:hypothetical protein
MADRDVIVVDGPEGTVWAFVAGFLAGRTVDREAVVYGSDLPLDHGSLGERLRALLPGGRHEALLLVDARIGPALSAALRAAGDLGLRVVEHTRLGAAWFRFAAETPSREAAARIHRLVTRPQPGVVLVDEEREELDPEAGGVELYAPVHEYTFRARGRITGALEGVVAIHRQLRDTDFVTVEAIHLEEYTNLPSTCAPG